MIRKKTYFFSILAFALTLTACFGGGNVEPTRYYTLATENISMPTASANFSSKKVFVKKFSIDPAYQRTNIVYRESPYDFMFYELDLWASRPEQIVTRVAAEYLEQSHFFKAVTTGNGEIPEYEFSGHIEVLEEVDEGSSQFAHLVLKLTFKDAQKNTTLWENRYDKKKSTDSREPRVTAEALSKLLADCMTDALQSIAQISE